MSQMVVGVYSWLWMEMCDTALRCPGCLQITTVFSHAQTVVLCGRLGPQKPQSLMLYWPSR